MYTLLLSNSISLTLSQSRHFISLRFASSDGFCCYCFCPMVFLLVFSGVSQWRYCFLCHFTIVCTCFMLLRWEEDSEKITPPSTVLGCTNGGKRFGTAIRKRRNELKRCSVQCRCVDKSNSNKKDEKILENLYGSKWKIVFVQLN